VHGSLPDEARIDADQAAEPFVLADIATVRPKLIVALGKSAASLFGASTAINSARRQVFGFSKYRSGLPIIQASCCASADEDRSCGEPNTMRGAAPMLNWLVDKGIAPHIPVDPIPNAHSEAGRRVELLVNGAPVIEVTLCAKNFGRSGPLLQHLTDVSFTANARFAPRLLQKSFEIGREP
jgi:hypothetical protein